MINKIELPAADVPAAEEQLVDELDFDLDDLLYISAKEGTGVDQVFESIIERISPPAAPELEIEDSKEAEVISTELDLPTKSAEARVDDPLKCFLFDARYVPERGGVACLIKVMSGILDANSAKQLMSYHMRRRYEIYQIGIVQPDLV